MAEIVKWSEGCYFDILTKIEVFQTLIDCSDTVLFIEHNIALIESAEQVITLGPCSGEKGGFKID